MFSELALSFDRCTAPLGLLGSFRLVSIIWRIERPQLQAPLLYFVWFRSGVFAPRILGPGGVGTIPRVILRIPHAIAVPIFLPQFSVFLVLVFGRGPWRDGAFLQDVRFAFHRLAAPLTP